MKTLSDLIKKHGRTGTTARSRRNITFQRRLFLTYVGIAGSFLLIFAFLFYHYVSGKLISNELNSLTILNESFVRQTDSVITGLDNTSANINYSTLMQSKLNSEHNLDLSEVNLPWLAELFVTINGIDLKCDQINIYDLTGQVAHVGMVTSTGSADISKLPWFDEVQTLGGRKLISLPYCTDRYSKTTRYPEWYISLYRTYTNQYNRSVGAIETVKRCKSVFKSILSYQKKNRSGDAPDVFVFNKDGSLLFPYDLNADGIEAASDYFREYSKHDISGEGVFSFMDPDSRMTEHCACYCSSYTDWIYISSQPDSVILRPVYRLIRFLAVIVIILFCLAALLSYRFSLQLVKPIAHLKHIIQRMGIENLGNERTEGYNAMYIELDELYAAFQKMSDTLKTSMNELIESRQQEFKATNLALQAQANPHFYYNTISNIIVLAEDGRDREVITLCRSLTRIMRYITDSSSAAVTVGDEIEYVQQYLYCMKVRYQTSLNYTVSIDDALLTVPVPKLIIQPLVENAIKYGTDCTPPWHITVSGHIYEDRWQIDVIDSGNGFSDEIIKTIYGNIAEARERYGMPELHINGLGIVNVYLRWKFFMHDDMIFSIGNTPDGHGICSIGARTGKTSAPSDTSNSLNSLTEGQEDK